MSYKPKAKNIEKLKVFLKKKKKDTYPEYTNNVNDDIYPSYEATFNGWVL